MIKMIIEMLTNYNYCTVEELNKAIDVLEVEFHKGLINIKQTIDTDGNGKVSVKESAKMIKVLLKTAIRFFRSNSAKYWG